MKSLLLMFTLLAGFSAFADCYNKHEMRQRVIKGDHIICRIQSAQNTLEVMNSKHQNMTKAEILEDIQSYIDSKVTEIEASKRSAKRSERYKFDEQRNAFLADSKVFTEEIQKIDNVNDILLLETDIIDELDDFEYSAYMDATSQVGGPGAIVGLIFSLPFDAIAAPFQAVKNKAQYSKTEWSRGLASFLINY